MPTSSVDADALRQRALALRRLADSVSTSEAVGLRTRAASDVWIGPTASRCLVDLVEVGRKLANAADDLIVNARGLERRAAALDIAVIVTVS